MIDLGEFSPTVSPLLALLSWVMKSRTVGSTLACKLLTDTSSTVCSVAYSCVVNSLSVLRHLAASLMHIVLFASRADTLCSALHKEILLQFCTDGHQNWKCIAINSGLYRTLTCEPLLPCGSSSK